MCEFVYVDLSLGEKLGMEQVGLAVRERGMCKWDALQVIDNSGYIYR